MNIFKKIYYIVTFVTFILLTSLYEYVFSEDAIAEGWVAIFVWGMFINFLLFLCLFAKDSNDGKI